jgi:hypothetical protein
MRVREHGGGRRRRRQWSMALGALAAAALALTGLGCGDKELVCVGAPNHVAVIASISKTDYDISTELAPEVAGKSMRHVASSCGELMVAIQDGRPDSNLNLVRKRFEPRTEEAFDPGAIREDMFEEGDEFVKTELLTPLNQVQPIGGSPFFATVAKTRREADARGWPPVTIVLIGDGFVVERSPETSKMIRFGQEPISNQILAEFTGMLGDLNGSCVMVVGFGAGTGLQPEQIRETERLLAKTFEAAGATFLASRSPDIDPVCPAQQG